MMGYFEERIGTTWRCDMEEETTHQKKMRMIEIATPESSAAERTSVEREVISVSLFQVKQGSQLTYNCISSTKRSGVYG